MKALTSSDIRQMYLDFFAGKGHDVKPSASLIPINDPTLLWINSGVATLKKYFDGSEVPSNPRITNAQKCIRTNDIENVGYTARHHTLFEMLGNWSIGDYFKEEAIAWAWEFLTGSEWMGFDPELLYVTYYPEDKETPEIWAKQPGFIADHLVPVEDNFWDIGSGPCGPDTEIFYDRGEEYNNLAADDPENYPGGENERWLEIWNLVFSEFNHMPDDSYQPLPNKNVDTGMGLERMVSVVQDTPTNFETDLFMPIIEAIESLTDGVSYQDNPNQAVSFKVIADHIRAVAFAISDGALPSNEGRGYILRRLIRRSVMHGRRLGIQEKFLARLVPIIADIMGQYYQELRDKLDFIQEVISSEEDRFHETIEAGEAHLESLIESLKEEGKTEIPGEAAFKLYDTFGFPLELTEEEAKEYHFTVDTAGFDQEMTKQRDRAREARSKEESMQVKGGILTDIHEDFEFVGYDSLVSNGTVKAIVLDNRLVDRLDKGSTGWVFFNRSPFYAEMGGQIADHGGIYDGNDKLADVLDVQKAPNGQFMHQVETLDIPLVLDQSYTLKVDGPERLKINQNHSATHLLHRALKEVLGDHASQRGSYVGPDRLRFDFSHFGKMTQEEMEAVETKVNDYIQASMPVDIAEMSIDDAKGLGAMALFGEKYGEWVRVVNMGNVSIELCGGTHVTNTNQIGTFKLLSETGIGAGIRRIEALTGQAAYHYYRDQETILRQVQEQIKVSHSNQILQRIEQLQDELKMAQAEIDSLSAKAMQAASDQLFDQAERVGDLSYIVASLQDQSVDQMRQLGDVWKQKEASDILIVAVDNGDKANLLVLANDQAIDSGVRAGDLIKALAQYVQGGGGGKPQMAQAGGKNPAGIPDLVSSIDLEIEKLTK